MHLALLNLCAFKKEKGTVFWIQHTIVPMSGSCYRLFKPLIKIQISSSDNIWPEFNSKQERMCLFVLHIQNFLCVNSSFAACRYPSRDRVCPGLLCLGKSPLKQIPGQITWLCFLISEHSGDVTRSVSGSVVWGDEEEATAGFPQLFPSLICDFLQGTNLELI